MEHYPERLNYFRSSGIWQTFKQDYEGAIRTYDQGIANAQALRVSRQRHRRNVDKPSKGGKKRGKGRGNHRQSAALQDSFSLGQDGQGTAGNSELNSGVHTSPGSTPACEEAADVGKEAGDDIERQMYFFRGMAKFQLASGLIEKQLLLVEGVPKPPGGLVNEGGELTLENIGIKVKAGTGAFPRGAIIGSSSTAKLARYDEAFTDTANRQVILDTYKAAMEDFKHFLSYFAVWEAPSTTTSPARQDEHERRHLASQHLIRSSGEKAVPFRGRRLVHHRSLNGRTRYSDPRFMQEIPPQP